MSGHHSRLPIPAPLTWVGNRGDGDLVDGFACAEACDDVLDPPQLLPHLGFLVLLVEKAPVSPWSSF